VTGRFESMQRVNWSTCAVTPRRKSNHVGWHRPCRRTDDEPRTMLITNGRSSFIAHASPTPPSQHGRGAVPRCPGADDAGRRLLTPVCPAVRPGRRGLFSDRPAPRPCGLLKWRAGHDETENYWLVVIALPGSSASSPNPYRPVG